MATLRAQQWVIGLKQFLVRVPILGSMLLTARRLFKDPYFGPIGDQIAGRLSWSRPQTIVQIGANDGTRFDPISALIRHRRRWRVLFVEPIPNVFERLVENYGRSRRFMFECSAVGLACGRFNFYYLDERARQNALVWNEWLDLVGSLDRSHVVKALGSEAARLEKFIIETSVPVVTLEALLNKWKISECRCPRGRRRGSRLEDRTPRIGNRLKTERYLVRAHQLERYRATGCMPHAGQRIFRRRRWDRLSLC